ncbi:hypothetical protein Ancab_021829 [Ancistrocladus abbreviatus]
MFKALCVDNHMLFPMLMGESIKSIEFVQGDDVSVGSIRQLNFSEGIPYKYVRQRIDELDADKFYCKHTTFEGDVLNDGYKYVVAETKIDPKGSGSICKMTAHFHPLPGTELEEKGVIKLSQENMKIIFKVVEEYLLANPQAYA